MERASTGVETELLDLSGATLEDLDRDDGLSSVAQRLLDAVQFPPTLVNAASSGQNCVSEGTPE
ncbi:hypothetical protein HUT19_04495 [Streptomyces sp. NA02950]|uniref:hypothetical protein n=1 Tax=Streptomyces sp. NA02950 TaxID=2742137 RepID=UPI0015900E4C|nr:hypothetical protein [Streptomyces sp. NA02950]QKV91089.1 hypothetical protein HUT19_04495 [Streptomyces sp. NA02950]